MRLPRLVLLQCLVLIYGACADPPPSNYPAQVLHVEDTTAAASDVLGIRIVGHEQLSGDFEIDPTGSISFPYIGAVRTDGKTPTQIEIDIRDRLADGYIRDPQVTVRIKEHHSKIVSVLGEVRKGTIMPFADGMTIIEAISQAGGFTPRAWENAVKVTRKSASNAEEFTVPVNTIANGKAPPFYMRPGDSVYVPKSPM
jgi:protein involved in polysaccharide export with SLBB domain